MVNLKTILSFLINKIKNNKKEIKNIDWKYFVKIKIFFNLLIFWIFIFYNIYYKDNIIINLLLILIFCF